MRTYLKILVLFVVIAAIVVVAYMVRRASAPESELIAKERERFALAVDKNRVENDVRYARETDDKMQFLDYRLAVAYNLEKKPDAAIAVLQKLIRDEQAREQSGVKRRSRSYLNETRYLDALIESYELKKDGANAHKARQDREKLQAMAAELRKIENKGEGKHVGLTGE